MVEQVASKLDEKDAMKSMARLAEGKFDFYDFLDQMKMIQKLGDLKGLMGLMPGFNKIKKQIPDSAFDPKRMKRTEAIVLSMTPDERRRPEIIKASRRDRIAKGSGTRLVEVNQLLKQFGEMRKMMRSPNKMKNMMQQMGGMPGGGNLGGLSDLMKGMKGLKNMKGKFPPF
jgi:signal recognition particle subunit SRP54